MPEDQKTEEEILREQEEAHCAEIQRRLLEGELRPGSCEKFLRGPQITSTR